MPRRRLIRRRIAVMPCAEVLPPLRIVLLDLHLRIAEANLDHSPLGVANINGPLLRLARSVERLVERDLLSLVLGHIKIGIGVILGCPSCSQACEPSGT